MDAQNENDLFRSIGRMEGQVAAQTQTISEVRSKVENMDARLAHLDRLGQRWKGGLAVIITLGAIIGAVLDIFVRWVLNR